LRDDRFFPERVPVTDDFWPIYDEYLRTERRAAPDVHAVWIALRKGRGKPLRYASFESALRYIGRKACISVHPHLFRHTLAQGVLDTTGNIKVAQEILGHSHLSTTADLYLRVDQHAMVTALAAAKSSTGRAKKHHSWPSAKAAQYVFDYDDKTISELERTIAQVSAVRATRRRLLMSALMSAVASCRASLGDLRGGFQGYAVDKFGGTLCVGGRGEHSSVVSS
jgi:hypothetical protein